MGKIASIIAGKVSGLAWRMALKPLLQASIKEIRSGIDTDEERQQKAEEIVESQRERLVAYVKKALEKGNSILDKYDGD